MNRFLPFEAIAAFRFMREGISQTMLIVLGVALGVGVIVFMSALISGLQSNIIRRTLNSVAPIVIIPLEQVARPQRKDEPGALAENVQPRSQQLRSIDQWQATVARLRENGDVRAISPLAAGPGLVTRGDSNKSLTIVGIMAEPYAAVTRLDQKLVAGTLRVDPGDVLLGRDLAEDLGVGIGDTVRLATPGSTGDTSRVRGIFDLPIRNQSLRMECCDPASVAFQFFDLLI